MKKIVDTADMRRYIRSVLRQNHVSSELLEISEQVALYDEKLYEHDPLYQNLIALAKIISQEKKVC